MMTQASMRDSHASFTDDEDRETDFFTRGRILRWALIGFIALIVVPFGMGIAAAKMFAVDRETAQTIAKVLPAILILGVSLAAWRSYRRHLNADPVLHANPRATDRQLGVAAIWRDAVIAGGVLGVGGVFLHQMPDGASRTALLVALVAVTGLAAVRGTLVYMRRIDEQERDANLWGAYCGVTLYLILYGAQLLAQRFGSPIPYAHDLIFGAVLVTTVAVTLWKRFR